MNRVADNLFVFLLYDFLYHSTVFLSRMFICLQFLSRLIKPEFQVIAIEFLIKQILQPAGTPPFLQNIIASPDRHVEHEHKDQWHLHGWLEVTLTQKLAFLWYFDATFPKKNITSMSGMLFLLSVQSLFQFGAKEAIWWKDLLSVMEKCISNKFMFILGFYCDYLSCSLQKLEILCCKC